MRTEKIIFASDLKGISLRKALCEYVNHLGIATEDLGIFEGSPLDFIDVTKQLALRLSSPNMYGVIISSDPHGVSMAANKFNFVRAGLCYSKEEVQKVRRKCNANVLCLDETTTSLDEALSYLHSFIATDFDQNNYGKRMEKLGAFATTHANKGVNLIVRGVISHENHILLSTTTNHNQEFGKGLFFLPGGHVEYNESAISALQREILEEMSLKVNDLRFLGALECSWDKKGDIYHELNLVYHVDIPNLSLDAPPPSSEPFIEFVWCPLSKLSQYPILPERLHLMLQQIEKNRDPIPFYSQMIKAP